MRLFGHAALHGLVVRVHAGVVVDLEGRRVQGCGDLLCALVSAGVECGGGHGRALSRMASWTGVVDMFDMDRESRNALRRSIGAHVLWIPLGREGYYQWYLCRRDEQLAGPSGNWSSALEPVMVILVCIKESAMFIEHD